MVVLVDLDDDKPPERIVPQLSGKPLHHSLAPPTPPTPSEALDESKTRPNPNVNGFSAALSCYPIVRQLASHLDLNTLHDLSRTCRQFRANLLEYRDQLIRHTLHCESENSELGARLGTRLLVDGNAGAHIDWTGRLTSGRMGRCARDMVGECQRCGTVVCRNCTIKPPATPTLRARHRRLCRFCEKAPLRFLTAPKRSPLTFDSSSSSTAPQIRAILEEDSDGSTPRAFTASAFERTPCTCDTMVWLCQPCSQQFRNADTMYIRAWTWRTQYSHRLGGVGTGAGEGNEGVECGRGADCLAARVVEHEVDCHTDTLADLERIPSTEGSDRWTGTSYHAQEIEGIGNVIKMKAKKQVHVGNCVKIYEDERDRSIQYLEREVAGKLRSWCSWCERVVLSERDKAGLRSSASSSSAPST